MINLLSKWHENKILPSNCRDVKEQIVDKMHSITDYVFLESMDHLDFIWGLDAAKTVYKSILDTMKKMLANH